MGTKIYTPPIKDHPAHGWAVQFDRVTSGATDDGMLSVTSGSGATVSVLASTNEADHPGVCTLATGTTTTGRASCSTAMNTILLGGGRIRFTALVKIVTLSDGTDTYTFRSGFGDEVGISFTEFVDGVAFRYSNGVNSGKWECYCRANDVETTADSGITVAADTWYCLQIEVNDDASSASFYIDGVSVATIATNIPSASTRDTSIVWAWMQKSAGTNAREARWDVVRAEQRFTTPRFSYAF